MKIEIAIDSIRVTERYRQDVGDLAALCESIESVGLLHPIVVTSDLRLVAGQRRLEACRSLGWKRVPVNVVAGLEDATALLIAERDENSCRKSLAPSEMIALGRKLEELERPKRPVGRPRENLVQRTNFSSYPTTRAAVGAALGVSETTYHRMKTVVQESENEDLPPEARKVAIAAREEMEATGNVTRSYDRVAEVTGRAKTNNPKPKPDYSNPENQRQRELVGAQQKRLAHAISGIAGYCRGLKSVQLDMALAAISDEEREGLVKMAAASATQLRRLASSMRNANENAEA